MINPYSSIVCRIQRICAQSMLVEMYSASAVERAIEFFSYIAKTPSNFLKTTTTCAFSITFRSCNRHQCKHINQNVIV